MVAAQVVRYKKESRVLIGRFIVNLKKEKSNEKEKCNNYFIYYIDNFCLLFRQSIFRGYYVIKYA
nr:MAG TPA: hypothetical protein [Bacteriophage sp.]